MARAVETCVHCGFCLPACPTYRVLGEEMDSPRGRIVLMKQALEGELTTRDVLPYIDRCLGCLGCETSCPSGVVYRDLLIPFRAKAESEARAGTPKWRARALLRVLESPGLFRLAVLSGQLARHVSAIVPHAFHPMLRLLPSSLEPARPLPQLVPAIGVRRARVALLSGCVQQVLSPDINHATIRVLAANGVEVVVPPNQGCCGALAAHAGHAGHARIIGRAAASCVSVRRRRHRDQRSGLRVGDEGLRDALCRNAPRGRREAVRGACTRRLGAARRDWFDWRRWHCLRQ